MGSSAFLRSKVDPKKRMVWRKPRLDPGVGFSTGRRHVLLPGWVRLGLAPGGVGWGQGRGQGVGAGMGGGGVGVGGEAGDSVCCQWSG